VKHFEPQILYEDNHLIAINKPAGMLVQGDKTGDVPLSELMKQYIKVKYNKAGNVFLGVTHRIDRPVSGVLLFARTSKALSRLNEMFRQKKVQKTYWAVVAQRPSLEDGSLEHYLIKDQAKNKSKAYKTARKNTKHAVLNYRLLQASQKYYLLEVLPKTGRHHQIRVQLAAMQCPIKGDIKYGFNRTNKDASIHLHARKISFTHPVKKTPITITANVPQHDVLWKVFEQQATK